MTPSISVVVPFHGTAAAGRALLDRLAALQLRDGDELIVADNTRDGVLGADAIPAPREQSPAHARNVAAGRASGEWVLFLDADCLAPADLLERYRAAMGGHAALAGEVHAAPAGTLIAAYATARRHLNQADHVADRFRPRAVTANLLVRRAAFDGVGGFVEGVRTAEDADFCFRLQDAGFTLGYAEHAAVEHDHRASLRGLLRQRIRYAAGAAWLERRHPGAAPRAPAVRNASRALVRRPAAAAVALARGDAQEAAFRLIDLLVWWADVLGRPLSNAAQRPLEPARTVVLQDEWHPAPHPAEARRRPLVQQPDAMRASRFAEDDGALDRLRARLRHRDLPAHLAPVADRLRARGTTTVLADPSRGSDAQLLRRERR